MKHLLKYLPVTLFLFVFSLIALAPALADNEALDFKLDNETGYGIKEIYISPSNSDDWGDNIMKDVLENGQVLTVTFNAKATAEHWDIKIAWVDGGADVIWKNCKLTEITKITLHYDRAKDETSATSE